MTNPTMPNNLLVCSEKLLRTKTPWKLDTSILGLLSNDHYIVSFNTPDMDNIEESINDISKPLRAFVKDKDIDKRVFIGYGKDCSLLPLLNKNLNTKFDVAVFVNNTEPQEVYKSLSKTCVVYNIFTKPQLFNNAISWARVNQYVATKLPAYISSKVSLEVAGLLMYDFYAVNFFNNTEKVLVELN